MKLNRTLIVAIEATALCTLAAAGPWVQTSQQRNRVPPSFVGMWRLLSRTQRLADGTTRKHPESVAYLIYVDGGRMCYVGMDPNRPNWKSETTPTPEEAVVGIAGLGAYCGTVDIHANEGFVVHHIEIEKVPNLVGRDRKRWFVFETPDRLRLRKDRSELSQPVIDDELVWERVYN